MGTGRLIWTFRRFFFYGVIVLLFCIFIKKKKPKDIFCRAFPKKENFNIFYAYMIWSIPGLILMIVLSFIYASFFIPKYPFIISISKYLYEDIVSPIYAFYQLIMGIFIQIGGGAVAWIGVFFDLIWTLFCAGFIFWGIRTQLQE